MSIAEVTKLPLREKFQIMEAIWADLSQCVEELEVPAQHKALLDARRERVASGESTLHDWDAVKHTIGHK
jgi:putative addiction module component (TIGR02574 family)